MQCEQWPADNCSKYFLFRILNITQFDFFSVNAHQNAMLCTCTKNVRFNSNNLSCAATTGLAFVSNKFSVILIKCSFSSDFCCFYCCYYICLFYSFFTSLVGKHKISANDFKSFRQGK